jgi:hypothetical protein
MGGSVWTLPWSNLYPAQLQDFWRNIQKDTDWGWISSTLPKGKA